MGMPCVVGSTVKFLGVGIQKAEQKPKRRELEAGRQVDDLAKVGPSVGVTLPNRCHSTGSGEAPQPKNPSWHESHECMNMDA